MSLLTRRTRARISFLGATASLVQQAYQRSNRTDDEPIPLAPRWLLVGAVYQLAYCWVFDHDVGTLRTSLWRRALFIVVTVAIVFLWFGRSPTVLQNISMGGSLARIGYRLWYGVLYPLPGTTE